MKKIVFLFAIVLTFCFTVSAQFEFTSKAGKEFSVSSAPQRSENRGGLVMEFYYTVEGSNLVVYEVPKTKGKISNSIDVTVVPIDQINKTKFKVQKIENTCYLQTGTSFTKITHGADYNSNDKYSSDNLSIYFNNCDDAEELRKQVLGDAADDLDLSDLDLSLEDKPKEKPKSTMPAHLFALLGRTKEKSYQFNRKNMEVWDYSSNNIFKVGKIVDSGSELKMLNDDESYFTYRVKDGKLYNGNKFLDIELLGKNICKSFNGERCFSKWEIDRDNEHIYSVFDKGATRYEKYKIMGEATDEEILLIFAYLEKF